MKKKQKQSNKQTYENHIHLYGNLGVNNYVKEDHRSYIRNFCRSVKKFNY